MIKIKIGKKRFKGVYSWNDVTLQKFTELASIPMPDGYEAYILADGKFDHDQKDSVDYYTNVVLALTDKQINEDFPAYFKKVCLCLSNVPERYLSDDLVQSLYDWYFRPFVVALLYHAPVIHFLGELKTYEPETVKRFRIGLQRFYLPEVVIVMEQGIPLAKEPILSYSEASDIFRDMKVTKQDVQRLATFMAIYCRKKGEDYNEAKVLERESLFMRVPMSVVWSVFFYTARRLPGSMLTILLFGRLPKHLKELVEEVRCKSMAVAG
jgi:hypothetical protein